LAFSPDYSLLAGQVYDYEDSHNTWVFQARDGKLLVKEPGAGCAFSPKGNAFALYDLNKVVVFDLPNGRRIADLTPVHGEDFLGFLCFDTQGVMYGAIVTKNELVVRNLDSGQETLRLSRHFWRVSDRYVAVHEHEDGPGKLSDFTLKLWDITTGLVIGTLPPCGESCHRMTGTADGRSVAYLYDNECFAEVFDPTTWAFRKFPTPPPTGFSGWTVVPQCSLSGKWAAVSVPENWYAPDRHWWLNWIERLGIIKPLFQAGVKLYDTTNGTELAFFPDTFCPTFTPDGKTLALINNRGQVEFWDFPLEPAKGPPLPSLPLAAAVTVLTFAAATWCIRRRSIAKAADTTSPTPPPATSAP